VVPLEVSTFLCPWRGLSFFHEDCHFPVNRQVVRTIRTRITFYIEIMGKSTGF